jgi:hypothetical protein
MVMPLCGGAPGSVRTADHTQSAVSPFVVQIFCPLTTYSSPSRTALVLSDARSVPAPGSL